MMNIIVKVGLGVLGVGVVAGVAAAVIHDNHEEKAANSAIRFAVDDAVREELKAKEKARQEKSIVSRIKKFVIKKFIKVLSFVIAHKDQVEAVGAIMGLVSAAISISKSVKDFVKEDARDGQLEEIQASLDELNSNFYGACRAQTHNTKVECVALEHIAKATNCDMDKLEQDLKALR